MTKYQPLSTAAVTSVTTYAPVRVPRDYRSLAEALLEVERLQVTRDVLTQLITNILGTPYTAQ